MRGQGPKNREKAALPDVEITMHLKKGTPSPGEQRKLPLFGRVSRYVGRKERDSIPVPAEAILRPRAGAWSGDVRLSWKQDLPRN